MANIVNRPSGPAYKQAMPPTDVTLGNLWFNSAGGNCAMSDGEAYGGTPQRVGIAGYAVAASSSYRLYFATETFSTLSQPLPYSFLNSIGVSTLANGYTLGWADTTPTGKTNITRFEFNTESFNPVSSGLPTSHFNGASVQNSVQGYLCGGEELWGVTRSSRISRLMFADESCTSLTTGLPTVLALGTGLSSGVAGYVGGGEVSFAQVPDSTVVYRLLFSTEGTSVLTQYLSQGRLSIAPVWNEVVGYYCGGGSDDAPLAAFSRIDRLVFSTETTAGLVTALATTRQASSGVHSYKTGYLLGGYTWSGSWQVLTSCEKLSFSNETVASMSFSVGTTYTGRCCFSNLNQPVGGLP